MPESSQKVVQIPEISLQRVVVAIEGETPLIVHRFGERARKQIESKQQGAARSAKPPREPSAEFFDSLYILDRCPDESDCVNHLEAHRYGFPSAGLKKALVYAGGRFADEQMTTLRGCLNIAADMVEISGSVPVMRSDTVRIDGGKTSSIAYRPTFTPWAMDVPIVFSSNIISLAQVMNLVTLAGFSIGIGDWRPEKNGTFGQFSIKGAAS